MNPILKEYCERVALGAAIILGSIGAVALFLAFLMAPAYAAEPPPPVLKIALVIDVDMSRDPTPDVLRAGQIISAQLGLAVQVTGQTYNHVADDTQPSYLLAKVPVDAASDVTLFLTARQLNVGAQMLRGSAIPFSAFTLAGVAVVRIENDGFDYEVIAHELGHTLGAPHDNDGACTGRSPSAGYIMQTYALSGSGTFSDCSRSEVVKYISAYTAPVKSSAAPPPPIQKSGGGSFDDTLIGFLCGVAFLAYVWRRR
jgi:hypothetical protein